MAKKVIILTTTIKRQSGKLYYCGTDTKGNLTVNEADMVRRGKKPTKAKKKK